MKINNREIQIVEYDTSHNWIVNFPKEKWLCIIVNNDRTREYVDEIARKIIEKDVCYVCATGKLSEKTHDLIDEEIAFREVDIEELYLPH